MAEVAGAVGDIAGTTVAASNPKLKEVVDIYNGAMGLIGIKNLGKGIVNFAKVLPEETKNLIQNNQSIRNALMAKYLDYRIAITELRCPEGKGIPQEYKSLIKQQENAFNGLIQIKLVDGSSVQDFVPYVKTKSGEAFFWSGMGVDGASKAYEIAKAKGGKTLESVLVDNAIVMPNWIDNPDIWGLASETYAAQCIGDVRVIIGKYLSPTSIWITKELPALQKNLKVKRIIQIDPDTLNEVIIFER